MKHLGVQRGTAVRQGRSLKKNAVAAGNRLADI
jgi:hypothetical protein